MFPNCNKVRFRTRVSLEVLSWCCVCSHACVCFYVHKYIWYVNISLLFYLIVIFYFLYVSCPYILLSKVNLFWNIIVREEAQCYALQEEFVADQLFQSSEHSSDDLLWITHSIFSSGKVLHLVLKSFVS